MLIESRHNTADQRILLSVEGNCEILLCTVPIFHPLQQNLLQNFQNIQLQLRIYQELPLPKRSSKFHQQH